MDFFFTHFFITPSIHRSSHFIWLYITDLQKNEFFFFVMITSLTNKRTTKHDRDTLLFSRTKEAYMDWKRWTGCCILCVIYLYIYIYITKYTTTKLGLASRGLRWRHFCWIRFNIKFASAEDNPPTVSLQLHSFSWWHMPSYDSIEMEATCFVQSLSETRSSEEGEDTDKRPWLVVTSMPPHTDLLTVSAMEGHQNRVVTPTGRCKSRWYTSQCGLRPHLIHTQSSLLPQIKIPSVSTPLQSYYNCL